jgi:uncharacterized protein
MRRLPEAEFRLVNATRSLLLAKTIEAALDSRARRRGLVGRQVLSSDVAFVISPSSAIHTFGMRFPIDVIFVNRNGRILKKVIGMKPRRLAARPWAYAVVEFRAHHPAVAHCRPGDVLGIEPVQRIVVA